MSIYHCSIKIISRSGGRSVVACAAYRAGEKLSNDETGLIHDFSRKGGVIMSEILLPDNAPERLSDRQVLWNEVQNTEKRSDAQLAREVEVAFPKEMSREQQIECVRTYIHENFVAKGMIADWALHDKGDGNPHAHIMLTVRSFTEEGTWQQKTRSVFANARDQNGRAIYDPALPAYDPKNRKETAKYRIPILDAKGIQQTRSREGKGTEYLWEKVTIPVNDWNDRANAEIWRASWAAHCNRYLSEEHQIDHRSYSRQGMDREPTIHEGITARNMERDGNCSDRCAMNRDIRERNRIRIEIVKLARELSEMIIRKARDLFERLTGVRRAAYDPAEGRRNDLPAGETAERKRDVAGGERVTAPAAIGDPAAAESNNGRSGRIDFIKREIEQREPDIAAAGERITRIKQLIAEKEAMQNESLLIKSQWKIEENIGSGFGYHK